jgi:hypothetical protein
MSPTSSPAENARRFPVCVTSPITVASISQRRQMLSTAGHESGSTIAAIRSCDSEIMISNGSMPGSRTGTAERSTSSPTPPAEAISDVDEASPAAPRSCSETRRPASRSASVHSISFLPVNGSPIWTLGRLASEPSSKPCEASTLAPPMPSRPVFDPYSTSRLPAPAAPADCSRSAGRTPTHIAFTRQFWAYAGSNSTSPPTFATPTQLP